MRKTMPYLTLANRLLSIDNAKERALLCLIYAGMCREGEVVRGRYSKSKAMLSDAITSFENKIVISVQCGKAKKVKKKQRVKVDGLFIEKWLPVPVVVRSGNLTREVHVFRNREAWLCNVIEGWVEVVGPNRYLFDYSTTWAEQIFKKHFPEFCSRRTGNVFGSEHTIHWLRGWRYTHYRKGFVTGRRVDAKLASQLGGWVNASVPEHYYNFSTVADSLDELENKEALE